VATLDHSKGESWNECHGDWGRDAALWLGRRAGRLRVAELGRRVGGLDHAVVSKAVARVENRMRVDQQLRRQVATVHF
jgi:chromosomal replication initiation ATPase DnaA